ncbi:6-pyruvoyl tetrahydrobiopterin synthase [Trichinella pseudospiralis]|uniref:6-pyruvoyl tetrahydrobiopterin synthase n=1 Tax=Trichinella pseudospiralis TaxID=6337 RepID=A0A0V1FR69_TRIPS|nr:6-pyruvoyl tetrahydrobiopterin synthase [Trichinella pseudospiralis]
MSSTNAQPIVYLTRSESFSASHRLHSFGFSSELTDQQNREIFGKCNNVNGHGHNYKIKVTIRKSVDPITGMAMNLNDLKLHLQKVTEELDHKNLDKDVPFFQTHTSTAENIAYYVWSKLQAACECLYEVKIKETENNYVIYRGERG